MKLIIELSYWKKPIPMRRFDWSAVTSDYEPEHACGSGETKWDAVRDLIDQLEDRDA